jgi:hypothetical protein
MHALPKVMHAIVSSPCHRRRAGLNIDGRSLVRKSCAPRFCEAHSNSQSLRPRTLPAIPSVPPSVASVLSNSSQSLSPSSEWTVTQYASSGHQMPNPEHPFRSLREHHGRPDSGPMVLKSPRPNQPNDGSRQLLCDALLAQMCKCATRTQLDHAMG